MRMVSEKKMLEDEERCCEVEDRESVESSHEVNLEPERRVLSGRAGFCVCCIV